jgi:hypothetical protein
MCLAHLHVGGLVAMGFDLTMRYLLTVSHDGRGVFDCVTWQKVARDYELANATDGKVDGIDPLAGCSIDVVEKNYDTGRVRITDPQRCLELSYEDGVIEVNWVGK